MGLNRRQAIILTNDSPLHWHIHSFPDLDVSRPQIKASCDHFDKIMKIVTLVSFHMLNHLRKILKLISYSFLRYLYQSNMAVTCHPTAMYFEYNSHFVCFFFQIAVWQQQCNDSYKDLNVVFILNLCKSNMASTIYLRIIMKTVVGKCIWRFPFWKIEDPSIQININTLQNMACHTGTHYQDNSPLALSLLKKTAIRLKIGHPLILSTGARYSNGLGGLDYMRRL